MLGELAVITIVHPLRSSYALVECRGRTEFPEWLACSLATDDSRWSFKFILVSRSIVENHHH